MRIEPRWLLCSILIAGCGTEPNPNIVGTWTLTSTLAGGTFACSRTASLVIDGSGSSLTGSLIDTQVSCTDAGQPIPVGPQTLEIVGGLDGRDINFATQIPRDSGGDCAYEVFDGRVTGTSMAGDVENRPVFCQGIFVQMQGTWEAQRQ